MYLRDHERLGTQKHIKHSVMKSLTIKIASAEVIRGEWSYGEVKKPETINYRTLRPEKGGLFCEKIFGPVKDWECACGKYSKIKHRGIVCDRCGVEVTLSKVRRERMAHIDLAVPIVHIGFFRSLPSKIGNLLGMSLSEVEKITYYEQYVVVDPKSSGLEKKQILSIAQYREYVDTLGKEAFVAKMGGEAIRDLLVSEDFVLLEAELKEKVRKVRSSQMRIKLARRLRFIETFVASGNTPESMVLTCLPVIPPDLRPLLALDGGRFATADLNDLQKRLLHRNCRLRAISRLKTPDVIYRSEMRLLQESVDAYFDNGRRTMPIVGSGGRPLKSLSESLKGKQGRFRQNLLGKRVDFSARSVIVSGPELQLNQCGLPKAIALRLFEPFIIRRLQVMNVACTVKAAKRMIKDQSKEVWDILEDVTKKHPVVLNRAPTLHRLGLQGFFPVLVEGKAIHLHPLVCSAYNADFDGDQMAVYLPLSIEAQAEVLLLMMASDNVFLPSSGKPTAVPTKDMVLGLYYLTIDPLYDPEEYNIPIKRFSSVLEVWTALECGSYDTWDLPWEKQNNYVKNLGRGIFVHEKIQVLIDGQLIYTTPGRIIFNTEIPKELGFYNVAMNKGMLETLVIDCYEKLGLEKTVRLLDRLKNLGFQAATTCAMSIGLKDLTMVKNKEALLEETEQEIKKIQQQHIEGIITEGERDTQEISLWSNVNDKISTEVLSALCNVVDGKHNPLYVMLDSGARGNQGQIKQLCGMRGLMATPSGAIVSFAIKSNFREGMSPIEFFIATHGGRKGLADTALRTADSGFLMRRLVDVAQANVVQEEDCGTLEGIVFSKYDYTHQSGVLSFYRLVGRYLAQDIIGEQGILASSGDLISDALIESCITQNVKEIKIRTILTCESEMGSCQKCYGIDMATKAPVCVGTPIGIIAAQSIGEPGTQLTMRTFHTGGIASSMLSPQLFAEKEGIIWFENIDIADVNVYGENHRVSLNMHGRIHVFDKQFDNYLSIEEMYAKGIEPLSTIPVDIGVRIFVKHGDYVHIGDKIIEADVHSVPIVSTHTGVVHYQDIIEGISVERISKQGGEDSIVVKQKRDDIYPQLIIFENDSLKSVQGNYYLPYGAVLSVKEGDKVYPGIVLARLPRSATKTADITGGLSRVVELFEARKPKVIAEIAKISGIVKFGGVRKGKRVLVVENEAIGMAVESLVPSGSHIIVQNGAMVKEGQPLTSGIICTSELLSVCGIEIARRHLLDQIQIIYKLQGVDIADKHIEIIIYSMLQKVRVIDPGDVASFLFNEEISKTLFVEANSKIEKEGGRPAKAEPLLLGITQAAFNTKSFIARASFQCTNSVVYQAAFSGSKDEFIGCKENVIVANMIPAGTGFRWAKKKTQVSTIGSFDDTDYWENKYEELVTTFSIVSTCAEQEQPT